ncbi:MAG TPA: hypothetical protein DD435_04985 [Cyanobacteria bacterium UBA8530]|nr:hypothetical protein [Cyanobacteria bacterium UBA8530]
MGFNPLKEKGIPLEKQFRNWSELNVEPYEKGSVNPYTRTRIITLNGIEVDAALSSHQFFRCCDNPEIKASLALMRRIEQQQQKVISGLIPAEESTLELTIGYEQVAVDITAFIARQEPDPYLKQNFDFGLLEDFDHLYRYANLLDLVEGKQAHDITGNYTEIMAGRPTMVEHRHPYDDVRAHYEKHTVDPVSRLHVLTLIAAEQQTMNFYMNVSNRYSDPIARGLYQEIAMIEEQHVTQYGSLLDPLETMLQREVFRHYNECYLYHSFVGQEKDLRIMRIWERHLEMELEHLRVACDLLYRFEGIEAEEILPKELPSSLRFEPNKEYVRKVLAEQVDLRSMGPSFLPLTELPKNALSIAHQNELNKGGVPSEEVIKEHAQRKGVTIQFMTEGPHPVEGKKKQK